MQTKTRSVYDSHGSYEANYETFPDSVTIEVHDDLLNSKLG